MLAWAHLREVQEAHEGLHVGQLHTLRECCGVQALGVAALIVQETLPQLHLLQLVIPAFAWRVRRQAGSSVGESFSSPRRQRRSSVESTVHKQPPRGPAV